MANASFLPEDYVVQAAERRTNIVSLVLFGIVMTTVFGAFLVTNRQWTQVRRSQIRINDETERAADDIKKMQELEDRRGQMVEKAELAMTLVEPVPRSVLLAMLVNAMPERLSLLDFTLRSEEIKKPRPKSDKESETKPKGPAAPKVASRGKTKAEAEAAAKDKGVPKPEPTRYLILVSMTGVAPTDMDVSRYMNALSTVPIFRGVRLDTTEAKEIDGLSMRQFKISFRIEPDSDVRALKSTIERPANPMTDHMRLAPPAPLSSVTEDPTFESAGVPDGGPSGEPDSPRPEEGRP